MPTDTLSPLARDDLVRIIAIALAVVTPPIQFGRGRKLPHESDAERAAAAGLIADQLDRANVRFFQALPAPPAGMLS